jgi:arylsulfatase A-like enzyme
MTAVVLAFDRLPLSLLGCYGATWIDTPAFDRLASVSATFDGCFASSTSLAGASGVGWASQLVETFERLKGPGIAVDRWRAGNDSGPSVLTQAAGRLATIAAGHSRRAVWIDVPGTGGGLLPDRQLVESFVEDFRTPSELRDAVAAGLRRNLNEIAPGEPRDMAWLGAWLPQLSAAGWLDPSRPPADRDESSLRRAVGAAQVSVLDAHLGQFLDEFDRLLGHRADTLLVAVGLRGELLMRHPLALAGMPPLVDEVLHVPLWVRAGISDVGTRRSGLASVEDVPALLAAWFGVELPSPSGMAPLTDDRTVIDGRHEALRVAAPAGTSLRTAELHAVYQPPAGSPEPREARTWLFLKPDDLWDLQDLAAQMPEVAERIQHEIETGVTAAG